MSVYLDGTILGCMNFTWREALYLGRLDVCVHPPDDVHENILDFCPTVQEIRNILERPMIITSWWRPPKYNSLIKGADESWHMTGGAIDFYCNDMSADEIRKILIHHLQDLNIRMENLPGANWVHIDNKQTDGARFFKP